MGHLAPKMAGTVVPSPSLQYLSAAKQTTRNMLLPGKGPQTAADMSRAAQGGVRGTAYSRPSETVGRYSCDPPSQ